MVRGLFRRLSYFFDVTLIAQDSQVLDRNSYNGHFKGCVSTFSCKDSYFHRLMGRTTIYVRAVFLSGISPIFANFRPFNLFFRIIMDVDRGGNRPSLRPSQLIYIRRQAIPIRADRMTSILVVSAMFRPRERGINRWVVFMFFSPVSRMFKQFYYIIRNICKFEVCYVYQGGRSLPIQLS